MRTLGAIFLLTLRSLVRSRFLASILVLALALVVLLPVAVRDDGTAAGRVQVLLRYTLVAVSFLLSVGTLGVAPGLVAGELESRRLQQVLVKPVRFIQVWAGKWLALLAVNAVMLGLAVLLAQGLLQWSLRGRTDRPALALPAPRAALFPAPGPGGDSVPPGGTRRWSFPAVPKIGSDAVLILRVQFMAARYAEPRGMEADWSLGAPGAEPFFRTSARLRALVAQDLEAPVPPGGLPPDLEAVFVNRTGETVLFNPGQGVRLLVPSGSYPANLARAYLLILFKLALLAAIGLTMGSLFSPPVAVLTAFFALVLFGFSGYIGSVARTGVFYVPHHHENEAGAGHEHGDEAEPGWMRTRLDSSLKAAFRGLDKVLSPVRRLDPLERVAGGERISPAEVARGFGVLVLLGSGLMAALGAAVFRRREAG